MIYDLVLVNKWFAADDSYKSLDNAENELQQDL